MIKKKIKVIALDLDGTLLTKDNKISQFNKETIFSLQKMQKNIVICTGRAYDATKKYVKELNLNTKDHFMVCLNGGEVRNGLGEILIKHNLPSFVRNKTFETIEKYNSYFHCFINDNCFIPFENDFSSSYSQRTGLKLTLIKEEQKYNDAFGKITIVDSNANILKINSLLKEEFKNQAYLTLSSPENLEVLSSNASKKNGLVEVLNFKNLDSSNLLAIGDEYNDYEMLHFAEVGVLMGNAPAELKKEFKYHTLSNSEDGVGVFLSKVFNI